MGYIYEADSA